MLGSDNASAVITKYNGISRNINIIIPATIQGMPVKEIGGFSRSEVIGVVIPEGVTTIGERAFEGSRLTSVTIPNSVTSIGNRAFANCEDLTSVTIPNGVTSIGENTFLNAGLTSVTIPNSVTSIGEGAFENTDLISVTIPNGVQIIGKRAFSNIGYVNYSDDSDDSNYSYDLVPLFGSRPPRRERTCLTSVTIPNSVISIGDEAFKGSCLTSVTIPNSITSIGKRVFAGACSLRTVTIPDSIISIGEKAFANSRRLTSVTIGSGIAFIEEDAFRDCKELVEVIIPENVTVIRYRQARRDGGYISVFGGCEKLSLRTQARLKQLDWFWVPPPPPPIDPRAPVTDSRDGQTYPTLKIGGKTWMVKNLNHKTANSWCYGNDESNCAKYGRLYTWNAAMSACPSGWRLPSDADWDVLMTAVGGAETASEKLKSASGWNNNGNGTDEYGFSALPGGDRWSGDFNNAGDFGYWWSATEHDAINARYRDMNYHDEFVDSHWHGKEGGFSVRCVRE